MLVRGGTGAETKLFMDGNLINNYFTNSVLRIAGKDRFITSLFKEMFFQVVDILRFMGRLCHRF